MIGSPISAYSRGCARACLLFFPSHELVRAARAGQSVLQGVQIAAVRQAIATQQPAVNEPGQRHFDAFPCRNVALTWQPPAENSVQRIGGMRARAEIGEYRTLHFIGIRDALAFRFEHDAAPVDCGNRTEQPMCQARHALRNKRLRILWRLRRVVRDPLAGATRVRIGPGATAAVGCGTDAANNATRCAPAH